MPDLHRLRRMAEREFPDLVRSTAILRDKLRVLLVDGSYIDFWWSSQIPGRFAHHWERTHVDGTIYRHDNMPHPRWQKVATFPQHFQALIFVSATSDRGRTCRAKAGRPPTRTRPCPRRWTASRRLFRRGFNRFHDGAQHTVGESDLPSDPEAAVRAFLEFARRLLEETEDA